MEVATLESGVDVPTTLTPTPPSTTASSPWTSWGPVLGLALFGCNSDLGCAEPVGDLVLGGGAVTIDEQG